MFVLFLLSQVYLGYINGIQLAKYELLPEHHQYTWMWLKALVFLYFFVLDKFLYKFFIIGVEKNIYKERGTCCSHRGADDLVINLPFKLNKCYQ